MVRVLRAVKNLELGCLHSVRLNLVVLVGLADVRSDNTLTLSSEGRSIWHLIQHVISHLIMLWPAITGVHARMKLVWSTVLLHIELLSCKLIAGRACLIDCLGLCLHRDLFGELWLLGVHSSLLDGQGPLSPSGLRISLKLMSNICTTRRH